MAVERAPGGSSLIDVLDRVLDKGIVIDAWVRVSLVGIDLVTVEARIVVASTRPRELSAGAEADLDRVMRENADLKRRLDEVSRRERS